MVNSQHSSSIFKRSRKIRRIKYGIARSRRGISTIIGAAFFITIMLLAFNLILWQMVQYDAYQKEMDKMAEMDRDRLAERLEVSDIFFTTSTPPHITIYVRNTGGISINVIRIYFDTTPVTIADKGPGGGNFTGGFLNVGESGTIDMNTQGTTLTATGAYTLTFVTERGNLFTSYYPRTSRFQSSIAYTFGSMRTRYAYGGINDSKPAGTIVYGTFNSQPWVNASVPYSHLSDVSNSPDFNIKAITSRPNYYAWQIRIIFRNIGESPIYIGNSSDVFLMSTIYQVLGQRAFQCSVWATLNISQSRVTSNINVPYEQAGTSTTAGSSITGGSSTSFMGKCLTLASGDYAYLVFTVTEYFCTFATTAERDRFTPFVFAGTAGLASPIDPEYLGTSKFYCGALLMDGFQVRRE